MSKGASPQQEEVTLLKDHTHRGEHKRASGKIRVNAVEKAWLQAQGVIARDADAASTVPAKK